MGRFGRKKGRLRKRSKSGKQARFVETGGGGTQDGIGAPNPDIGSGWSGEPARGSEARNANAKGKSVKLSTHLPLVLQERVFAYLNASGLSVAEFLQAAADTYIEILELGYVTKPQEKPEIIPETKPQTESEIIPETKPQTESEIIPESKTQTKPETKPERRPLSLDYDEEPRLSRFFWGA